MGNEYHVNSKEFIKKIEEEIKKSGFLLEIEVASELSRRDWIIRIHEYYIDEREKKSREIDIVAHKQFEVGSPDYDFFHVTLVIECKKSHKKPWVFFTVKKGREFVPPLSLFLLKFFGVPKLIDDLKWLGVQYKWIKECHYFNLSDFPNVAIISFEPFSNKSQIFEAKMQVLNALNFIMKEMLKLKGQVHSIGKRILFIFYPLIIFDGHLFEYTQEEKIRPVMYLQYLVRHGFTEFSGTLAHDLFLIDVMKKEFFPKFLNIIDEDFTKIRKVFSN